MAFRHLSNHVKKIHQTKKEIRVIWIFITIIIVGLLVFLIYNRPKKSESEDILGQVSKLMTLPHGETPTIANITDVNKLKDQPFFRDAQNGDKLIVYAEARKAILYRPFTNKIINVSALSGEDSPKIGQATGPEPTAKKTFLDESSRIAIYTEDGNATLTKEVEDKLRARFPKIRIVDKSTSTLSTYTKTKVIDLGGNKRELVSELASLLSGEVVASAEGEITPIADILIIAVEPK